MRQRYRSSFAAAFLVAAMNVQAAPVVIETEPTATPTVAATLGENSEAALDASSTTPMTNGTTLAAQLRPTNKALSAANQDLLSHNTQLRRQVNDLQTQVNVLVYESKGQLFLYGAFTVLISLLIGVLISWLVFSRRERW
ncbi:hypothetical protein ES754_06355 [Psychrobacter frigidicola]|uniref:SH3 domain protein n=1 Tax=Psychrobacter frigidicola TaxID=45611 RepID=A0A5C7A653_9GAMM|nr:hypothetical protein ES754_06355 [Psychrobacter frigidicola]